MNIFVGNLPKSIGEEELKQAFNGYGTLLKAVIVKDKKTNENAGYAHVFIVPDKAALAAISDLNRGYIKGNMITVRECIYRTRDRSDKGPSGTDSQESQNEKPKQMLALSGMDAVAQG